jgi:hypothetical protein
MEKHGHPGHPYHGSNTLVFRNCCRIEEKKTQIRFDIELIEVIGCEYS